MEHWANARRSTGTYVRKLHSFTLHFSFLTELEERRKAFVDRDADYATKIGLCGTLTAKKKRKQLYESRASTQFDR
jgi:hypothetical protein